MGVRVKVVTVLTEMGRPVRVLEVATQDAPAVFRTVGGKAIRFENGRYLLPSGERFAPPPVPGR
jgi:hypothetical protein